MSNAPATRRLVGRLLLLVVLMFGFGFALVPIYDLMCRAFDINGKIVMQVYQGQQVVDENREVHVQFLATNTADMVWEFAPKADQLTVHPGASNQMLFVAYNPTNRPMTAQAIPSVAPSQAAAYLHKTECFCFTQQVLQPGERIEMPVRFIIDRDLPADVHQLTLSYTLFDVTARHPPVPVAGR